MVIINSKTKLILLKPSLNSVRQIHFTLKEQIQTDLSTPLDKQLIMIIYTHLKSLNLQDSGVHSLQITLQFDATEQFSINLIEPISLASFVLINPTEPQFFLEGLKSLMFLLPQKLKVSSLDSSMINTVKIDVKLDRL